MSTLTRAAVYTARITAVTAAVPVLAGAAAAAATAKLAGWELQQLASSPLSAEARRLRAKCSELAAANGAAANTPARQQGHAGDGRARHRPARRPARSGQARAQLAAEVMIVMPGPDLRAGRHVVIAAGPLGCGGMPATTRPLPHGRANPVLPPQHHGQLPAGGRAWADVHMLLTWINRESWICWIRLQMAPEHVRRCFSIDKGRRVVNQSGISAPAAHRPARRAARPPAYSERARSYDQKTGGSSPTGGRSSRRSRSARGRWSWTWGPGRGCAAACSGTRWARRAVSSVSRNHRRWRRWRASGSPARAGVTSRSWNRRPRMRRSR